MIALTKEKNKTPHKSDLPSDDKTHIPKKDPDENYAPVNEPLDEFSSKKIV